MSWHPNMPDAYKDAILTGDCRELAKAMPDESVDLIFTDPPYAEIECYRWLAGMAMRVLKPDSAALVYYGIGYLPQTVAALTDGGLAYRWQAIWYISNGMKRADMGFCNYSPFLWLEKGHSRPFEQVGDLAMVAIPDPGHARQHQNHRWEKQPMALARYVEAFSRPGAVVWDPFTGGGTVPAVCKALGRHYVASEIDPATAERARLRVEQTQPPLFVPQPAQLPLDAVPS